MKSTIITYLYTHTYSVFGCCYIRVKAIYISHSIMDGLAKVWVQWQSLSRLWNKNSSIDSLGECTDSSARGSSVQNHPLLILSCHLNIFSVPTWHRPHGRLSVAIPLHTQSALYRFAIKYIALYSGSKSLPVTVPNPLPALKRR
jgi:hypothetical protein